MVGEIRHLLYRPLMRQLNKRRLNGVLFPILPLVLLIFSLGPQAASADSDGQAQSTGQTTLAKGAVIGGDAGSWTVQRDNSALASVFFIDSLRGWSVGGIFSGLAGGGSNRIMHTEDGGVSWSKQATSTTNGLNSVYFVDPSNGWAVGNTGVIIHTSNGGNTWTAQVSGTSNDLRDLVFFDSLHGWAVGDHWVMLYTADGGNTWINKHEVAGDHVTLNAISFNGPTGFAVGTYGLGGPRNGVALHTTDGGEHWTELPLDPYNPDVNYFPYWLNDISFSDSLHGWIVGDGSTVYSTSNGGYTWLPAGAPSSFSGQLVGISFTSSLNGWAVGGDAGSGNAVLFSTSNGGATWTRDVQIARGVFLRDVFFSDAAHGWAVGTGGERLRTVNGGATWNETDSGVALPLYGISFVDGQTGWAVGYGGTILHTSNGGANWTAQESGTTSQLNGVVFKDQLRGWAVGSSGKIVHTSDGGANWITQVSGTGNSLAAVSFVDNLRGWAVGMSGTILHTSNGGTDWSPQTSPKGLALSGVTFSDALCGWAVGQGNLIIHTSDGGSTWTEQLYSAVGWLMSVTFVDASHGWAVGNMGAIKYTSNGGSTWSNQTSGVGEQLNGVAFNDASHGWTVGQKASGGAGAIRNTLDGGTHWSGQTSGTGEDLNGVAFADASHGWAVGTNGVILVYVVTHSAPTVTTEAVSGVGIAAATGNGTVVADGGSAITERGIVWNTTGGPTTADGKASAAGTTGVYAAPITGLTPATAYHVRAYAINSAGTSYGSEVTFTTLAGRIPLTPLGNAVTLEPATASGATTVNATVTFSDGGCQVDGWGTMTKVGEDYRVDTVMSRWAGPAAQSVKRVDHVYSLGAVSPGSHNFNFYANGTLVKTTPFVVSASAATAHSIAVTSLLAPGTPALGKAVLIQAVVVNKGTTKQTFTLVVLANGKTVSKIAVKDLAPGSERKLFLRWTPSATGEVTLAASVAVDGISHGGSTSAEFERKVTVRR